MTVLVYSHDACLLHDTGPGHPERPDRITAALAGARGWVGAIEERAPRRATLDELALVHDPAYVEAIAEFCAAGGGQLDPDTAAVTDSWEAALRSAGAGLDAIDALGGEGAAFLAVRPPGHHALTARAMGFCLFNNVAISAEYLSRMGQRVAILDWDVHHGNGTQDTFAARGDVLYLSLHEFPFYPGTGWVDELGVGEGLGRNVNVPLPSGSAGDAIELAMNHLVMPILYQFDPDWILISAGYDAHVDDPLAGLRLEATDYGAMAHLTGSLGKPVIVFLEGGYDLDAIAASVSTTLDGLSGVEYGFSAGSPEAAERLITAAIDAAAPFWSAVQGG